MPIRPASNGELSARTGHDGDAGYIRGGGGIDDKRRAIRVLLGFSMVILAVLVVVLSIEAVNKNSRIDRLRHRGVSVDVTVTGCLGITSGTGITVTSYDCTGAFTLDGRNYSARIVGSNANLPVGDTVKAIADSRNPTTLSTVGSVAKTHSSWQAFLAPAILFLVLLAMIAAVLWLRRRDKAQGIP